jgi:hypothetical protein
MEYVKSSFCGGGECLEVGKFTKSSACDSASCLEVGHFDGVTVRNSKEPDIHVVFTTEEWRLFLLGAKAGEFDIADVA